MIINKKIRMAVVVGIAMTCITGCDLAGEGLFLSTGLSDNQVFEIKDSVCTLPQAMLLLTTEKSLYEKMLGNDIWTKDMGGISLEEYVKKDVKNQLAEIKCLNLLGKKNNIKLSDEEKKKANTAAQNYFGALSEEEISYMNIEQEDVINMYMQYLLANKVYDELTKDITPSISDDDAKIICVQSIFIRTYSYDANGNRVEYNESQKENAKKKMQTIQSKIKSGRDFAKVASTNTDSNQVEYQIAKGSMNQEYENVAFSLSSGMISDIVETADGYYLIKCISDYMEQETQEHKQQLIDTEKKKAFNDIYIQYTKSASSEFNDELWNSISFSDMNNISVSNFYDIIKQ